MIPLYGPMGLPIGPLVDLRWKFDIRCQLVFFFLELLKYVITGLLVLQKKCFLRIEFPNGEQLSPAKMYRVMLQSGNAFEQKSMAFISSLRAAEKKITGAHCCLRF